MLLMESALVAGFMLLVVFVALLGLYLAVKCFSFVVNRWEASDAKANQSGE
jgi:hypothetical protein